MEEQNFWILIGGIVLLWFIICLLANLDDWDSFVAVFFMFGAFFIWPFLWFLGMVYYFGNLSWFSP